MSLPALMTVLSFPSRYQLLTLVSTKRPRSFGGWAQKLIKDRVDWLLDFVQQEPRGYATLGTHLTRGTKGIMLTLKSLAAQEEKFDPALRALLAERQKLVRSLNPSGVNRLSSLFNVEMGGRASTKNCTAPSANRNRPKRWINCRRKKPMPKIG